MYVYHPSFNIGTETQYIQSLRAVSNPTISAALAHTQLIVNTAFAALFVIPRPVDTDCLVPPLPTLAQPLWRPSSFGMRLFGMTDAQITRAHKRKRICGFERAFERITHLPENSLPSPYETDTYLALKRLDNAFEDAFWGDYSGSMKAESKLNEGIADRVCAVSSHLCYTAGLDIDDLCRLILSDLVTKHRKLYPLPAKMPTHIMREVV